MSPTPQISDYMARKLAGLCVYPGCEHDHHGASLYCQPHHDATKARARRWIKGRRKALKRKRRCIDCKAKSDKLRCPGCYRTWKAGRVDKDAGRVDNPDAKRGHVKLEADSRPGRTVAQRYVGRSRRGAPSKADTDRDARIELTRAVAAIVDVRDEAIAILRSQAVTELGAIQRREAAATVADRLLGVARICEAVAEYLCKGRAAEHGDEDK